MGTWGEEVTRIQVKTYIIKMVNLFKEDIMMKTDMRNSILILNMITHIIIMSFRISIRGTGRMVFPKKSKE